MGVCMCDHMCVGVLCLVVCGCMCLRVVVVGCVCLCVVVCVCVWLRGLFFFVFAGCVCLCVAALCVAVWLCADGSISLEIWDGGDPIVAAVANVRFETSI